MLFRADALDKIRTGRVSVVYRRWRQARVRAGTKLRTPIGLIEIVSITEVPAANHPHADAPGNPDHPLFRIEVRFAGADPRIALRADAEGVAEVLTALDRIDAASRRGPWTRPVLRLIKSSPAVRAGDLFAQVGYADLASFKRDVRRLKELGLTESLEVGYRLSPRGEAVLQATP